MRITQTALWASGATGIALAFAYRARLPERVATHFGSGGQANGWMSRDAHLLFMAGLFLVLTTLLSLSGPLMVRTPARWINTPRKDRWLATPASRAAFAEIVGAWCEVFGVAMNLFFIGLNYALYRANLETPARLDERTFWLAFAFFMAFSIGMSIWLMIRLNRPPEA